MTSNRRFLVLTAGAHQIPIIRTAQKMGLTVVATDRSVDAPGLSEADFPEIVDVKDRTAVLDVARRHRISGIVAEQTDVAVQTGAFVADELGLASVGLDVAVRATNKLRMRDACKSAGIPTPEYRFVESAEAALDAAREIGLPVVVKPVDSQASRGVSKVFDANDIGQAFGEARTASGSGGVLVEEMMTGTEGSIESLVQGAHVSVLGYCDKVKSRSPSPYDLRLIYPGDYSQHTIDELVEMNARAIGAIGIRTGFTHAEFIVTPQGVRLIEIAARGCGARVVTDLLPAMLGTDLIALRIRQALGEAVPDNVQRAGTFGILRFLELSPGRITHTAGTEEAARLEGVIAVHFPKRVGETVSEPKSGDGRPGFVLAIGDSRESVIARADRAIAALDVHIHPGN